MASTLFNQCYLDSLFYHHRHPVAALLALFPWHFIPLTLFVLWRLPFGLVTVPSTNDREIVARSISKESCLVRLLAYAERFRILGIHFRAAPR